MSTPASALLQKPRRSAADADMTPEDATRVYRGRSIDELIPRIEADLGADAIVVRRTRGLEGGFGGFFQRQYVEVVAKAGTPRFDMYDEGLGESALPPAPTPAPAVPRPNGAYVTDTLATIAAAGSPEPVVVEDPPAPAVAQPAMAFQELTSDTFGAALAEAEQALPMDLPEAPSPISDPFAEELELLDRGMQDLQVRPPAMPAPAAPMPAPAAPMPTRTAAPSRARTRIEAGLLDVGMSQALTAELLDAASAHILPLAPRTSLAKAAQAALVARISQLPLLPAHSATVAVVGPGGSGKTTCCAAILGAYRRAGTMPASCATVTLVGEREEPAMLLSPRVMEPMAIASTQARQILAQTREEGLLLLDLPPLSPAERPAIRRIANLLGELRPDRVVVALPATLGAKAAAQLLQALKPLGASAMAITHADETDQLGVAVEAACNFGLAPEYLLDRGRVRGGLTRIDPTQLAERLLS